VTGLLASAQRSAVTGPRILVVDDNSDVLGALRLLFKTDGLAAETVTSPDAALGVLAQDAFALVLIDLNYTRDTTSGREGLELLARIRAIDPHVPIIAMTAWGTIELAVRAMRAGVDDFVLKPWDNATLLHVVRTHLEVGRARRAGLEAAAVTAAASGRSGAASEMQRSLLPRTLPALSGIELAASWRPFGDVGGDYYDVLRVNDERTTFCIADVAGKGLPAALLMANLQAVVRTSASSGAAPASVCAAVNDVLCRRMDPARYVSLFVGALDLPRRRFEYANGGHNFPILVHRDGTVDRLARGGPVLGVLPDAAFEAAGTPLRGGDRLVLFTDGLVEARDSEGRELGDERLVDLVVEHRGLQAAALQSLLMERVEAFSAGRLDDDVTLIVLGVA
jgi:sigma-B regulation protein RsbU (phosphoserine phosphatase)